MCGPTQIKSKIGSYINTPHEIAGKALQQFSILNFLSQFFISSAGRL